MCGPRGVADQDIERRSKPRANSWRQLSTRVAWTTCCGWWFYTRPGGEIPASATCWRFIRRVASDSTCGRGAAAGWRRWWTRRSTCDVGLQLSLLAAPTLFNNKAPTISDPRAPYNMLIIYSPIIERESQLFITYVVAASAAVSLFFSLRRRLISLRKVSYCDRESIRQQRTRLTSEIYNRCACIFLPSHITAAS